MNAPAIRVLVVDDDFRVAGLHADFVAKVPGFAVVGMAHTASAAGDAVRAHHPDLVLLDLYLPDENGLSLLPRLREGTGPHPDVIAITAARDLPSIRAAMQLGVVHYLVKPFPFRTLAERLTAYRSLWAETRAGGEVGQEDVDRLFRLARSAGSPSPLKGHSEQTTALIRAAVQPPDSDWSASEIAGQLGISRATAQRYLAQLVKDGELEMHLRYGSTGRPEHRYRKVRAP
jgi:response regulator of citrate/malate metabolism